MSEFCSKCVEKEAQIELLVSKYSKEIADLKERVQKLENENEALVMDVAFYGGGVINLSCNDK